jgi:hypothetical protein
MSATQRVTSDKSDIPAHYVQLSSYGCNARDKPATPEYQTLHGAWTAKKLGGWKLMATPTDQRGPIYVDPKEAEQVLSVIHRQHKIHAILPEKERTAANPSGIELAVIERIEVAVIALCDINNGITLMQATLERLATAVESIATKP